MTLHIIMPNQISGPNSAVRRIRDSALADRYEFSVVSQTYHAGGRVNFSLIRDLRRQIMSANPDLVHLSGLQASGFHAIVATRLATRAPVLVTIRGFSGDVLSLSRLQRAAFALVESATLALCTGFVTVTRVAGRRPLVRLFRRKYLGAVHNAAPSWSEPALPLDRRRQERQRLGLPEDAFIAAVAGRMVDDKGVRTVVEVATRLPEGMTICFVGDGPWLEKVHTHYPDLISTGRIVTLGQRSDVKEILLASDAFLFATLHENLSNALLEAMALGLPTVVTNVGGNPEVVSHGETGFLVPPGDAVSMVSHLLALRESPELCRRMGDLGRSRVLAEFSQDHIYSQLAELYDGLLGRGRRPVSAR